MRKRLIICALCAVFVVAAFFPYGASRAFAAIDTAEIIVVGKDGFDLGTKLSENTDEDYYPAHRRFQSMAKIEIVGNRIWACWSTGGTEEPVKDNYIAVAYSDDRGTTWVDPYMIIDHADSANVAIKNSVLWLDPSGKLWLMYFKEGMGLFAITSENADATDINDVVWSKETYMFNYGSENKPTVLSSGEWLYMSRETNNPKAVPVISSVDGGKTWAKKSTAISSVPPERKFAGESSLVEKKNGSLVLLSRVEAFGGVERYVSADKGNSWTSSEVNLPAPLNSPGSRFVFRKLKSGNWLFVTNSAADRSNLTAYLSTDEGVSWSKGLSIDKRLGAEYPDAAEDDNGNIYLIYDCGRFENQQLEIRYSIFTEDDLVKGEFIGENSVDKGIVNKLNPNFKEVTEVSFGREITVKKNTPESEIIGALPASVTVKDGNGKEYSFGGKWTSDGYDEKTPGEYVFKFSAALPEGLDDTYGMLTVKVTVEKSNAGAIVAAVAGGAVIAIAAVVIIIVFTIRRKRKDEKSKS